MKVELTGGTRYFAVTDDKGKRWTVTEMYDELKALCKNLGDNYEFEVKEVKSD